MTQLTLSGDRCCPVSMRQANREKERQIRTHSELKGEGGWCYWLRWRAVIRTSHYRETEGIANYRLPVPYGMVRPHSSTRSATPCPPLVTLSWASCLPLYMLPWYPPLQKKTEKRGGHDKSLHERASSTQQEQCVDLSKALHACRL